MRGGPGRRGRRGNGSRPAPGHQGRLPCRKSEPGREAAWLGRFGIFMETARISAGPAATAGWNHGHHARSNPTRGPR